MKRIILLFFTINLSLAAFAQNAEDPKMNLAFHFSATDDVRNLDLVVGSGYDINKKNTQYNTSAIIHVAAELGSNNVIKYLAEKGADLNIRNGGDATPLRLALLTGNYRSAELLLRLGADINSRDTWLRTPLFDFTLEGNYEAASFLLSHGADVHTYQYDHSSALHVYILHTLSGGQVPDKRIIMAYLEYGLNPAEKDAMGYSLLHTLAMQDDTSLRCSWNPMRWIVMTQSAKVFPRR